MAIFNSYVKLPEGSYITLGKFDHDLTVLPHWKSWLAMEIIPKWPNYSG